MNTNIVLTESNINNIAYSIKDMYIIQRMLGAKPELLLLNLVKDITDELVRTDSNFNRDKFIKNTWISLTWFNTCLNLDKMNKYDWFKNIDSYMFCYYIDNNKNLSKEFKELYNKTSKDLLWKNLNLSDKWIAIRFAILHIFIKKIEYEYNVVINKNELDLNGIYNKYLTKYK